MHKFNGKAPQVISPALQISVSPTAITPGNPNGVVVAGNVPLGAETAPMLIQMLSEAIYQMAASLRAQADSPVAKNIVLVDGSPAPMPHKDTTEG
jgi:hypothetical protein